LPVKALYRRWRFASEGPKAGQWRFAGDGAVPAKALRPVNGNDQAATQPCIDEPTD